MWSALVDTSHYQNSIDWSRVKNATLPSVGVVRGAYLKCTERNDRTDPLYVAHAAGAKAAGVPTGAYHFARPSLGANDAVQEADWFVGHLAKHELPPMLDLESTSLDPHSTTEWALNFCAQVKRRTGITPIIYTGAYFGMAPDVRLSAYPLWIAAYPAGYAPNPDPTHLHLPHLPASWNHFTIWQYTSSGHVDGIAGNVDCNVVDSVWLDAILKPTPPPVPHPLPPEFLMALTDAEQHELLTTMRTTAAALAALAAKVEATETDVADIKGQLAPDGRGVKLTDWQRQHLAGALVELVIQAGGLKEADRDRVAAALKAQLSTP